MSRSRRGGEEVGFHEEGLECGTMEMELVGG